jgi:hypothetical protein
MFGLSVKVNGPDALDLAGAAGGHSRYFMDSMTGGAQGDNPWAGPREHQTPSRGKPQLCSNRRLVGFVPSRSEAA